MTDWYVMRTVPEKELQAVKLIQSKISRSLWRQCRILKKQKLFRTGGELYQSTETMFPGYIFVQTGHPDRLQEELAKSREFPKLVGNQNIEIVAVEDKDLKFLKDVCGENLEHEMELSRVEADAEGNLLQVEGTLGKYRNRIVRKRLRKRYVLASVDLFNRTETVLFGIHLPGDRIRKTMDVRADIEKIG